MHGNHHDIQNSQFLLQIFAIYIDIRYVFLLPKVSFLFKGTGSDRPRPRKEVRRLGWVSKHETSNNSAKLNSDQYNKSTKGIGYYRIDKRLIQVNATKLHCKVYSD